jgi:hypothetical protein
MILKFNNTLTCGPSTRTLQVASGNYAKLELYLRYGLLGFFTCHYNLTKCEYEASLVARMFILVSQTRSLCR